MNSKLTRASVLVLNRHWQAIHTRTPTEAFGQMSTNTAQGLRIENDVLHPVKWEEWITLPVRAQDESVRTPNRNIRIPTVIVLGKFAGMPRRKLKFSLAGLWIRDNGTCQYTGKKLRKGEGNIDHILPRSRGGAHSWENCVLSSMEVNSRKADRLPQEAGLQLLRTPQAPQELPAFCFIPHHNTPADWNLFLSR